MSERSPRQSLIFAAVSGLVSVVPVGRAPRGVKRAVIAASGALAGVAGFVALRRPDLVAAEREPLSAPQSMITAAGIAVAAGGGAALSFASDRFFEQALVRRGVRRPRLVLGAVGGVLAYALDVVDRRTVDA